MKRSLLISTDSILVRCRKNASYRCKSTGRTFDSNSPAFLIPASRWERDRNVPDHVRLFIKVGDE